jgi:hypothetical protein
MLSWLTTRIGRFVAAAGALLAVVVGVFVSGRREGAQKAKTEALEDEQKRVEKGREHLRDNRDKPNVERLRDNDRRW